MLPSHPKGESRPGTNLPPPSPLFSITQLNSNNQRGDSSKGALGSGSNRRYLGDPPASFRHVPELLNAVLRVAHVHIDKPVRQISMKDDRACCVTDDGEVWHWGAGIFAPQMVRELQDRNLASRIKAAFCGSESLLISIGRGKHNSSRLRPMPSQEVLERRARYIEATVFSLEIETTEYVIIFYFCLFIYLFLSLFYLIL